jgi:protocatechuate 3,4-dioxygenase beta subunit
MTMGKWIVAVTVFLLLLSFGQAAAQAEATPNTSVTGTVLMPDGSPAKGATVEVRNLWWDHRPIAVVKTDESGSFKASPAAGRYFLHASLDTLVAEDRRTAVEVKAGGSAGPYELKLEKGCVVSGIVTEKATGKPLEGAEVITDEGDIAVTSATGGYSFVLPKRSHRLSALKDGFHRPVLNISAAGDTMDLPIELKPGGTIKGKVRDKESNPIAGARVGLSVYSFYFQYTKANEAGEYVLVGFDPDTSPEISARADGFESVYDTKVVFAAGEREATLDFRLAPVQKRNVTGRVTQKNGKPINGATVTYGISTCHVDLKSTATDADGKYQMQVPSRDKNIIMAQAKGCAPSFDAVPADINAVVNLVMQPGHWVEGQFEDDEGKSLKVHISVCAESEAYEKAGITYENRYRWIQDVDTDDKGHFRLEDLPAKGVSIETFAYKEGYARIDGMPLEVDRADHIIVVDPTGRLSGKVVSAEDGSPIAKFEVVAEPTANIGTKTIDSPDGTFSLTSTFITPGQKLSVGVQAPGYVRETKYGVEAKAKPDFGTVFKLRRAPDFEGTVADDQGGPLEGVLVTAVQISSPYSDAWYEAEKPTARTNAEGRFKIASVPMDAGRVILEKAGYGTVAMPGVILKKPLAVTMQKAAVITGTVKDEAGKPVSGIRTEVYGKLGEVAAVNSDDKGGFRFENLPPGRYLINASDYKAGRISTHTAEVKSGEVYEIDWDKPGEAELEGKVTRNGQPVAEASVLLFEGDERMWCSVGRTDAKGAYRVTVPKATEYRVNYHAKKYEEGHGSHEMTIKPGKNHLDIKLPGASMSGKVFDQSTGKPITNTDVALYTKMTSQEVWSGRKWHNQDVNPWFNSVGQAKTDDKGRFTFQNLVPGECLVSMKLDQLNVPSQAITLGKDEQKTGVIVRIPPTGQAHVKVVDDSTGKPLEDPRYIFCVNEQGFRFSVAYDQSGPARSPTYKMVRTPEGKLVFPSLPPGKYSIWVYSETHLPIPVTFKVMADETTDVTLRMKKSERIIFRLVGDHLPREILRLGYRITTPDGKPVLTGYWGPTFGNDTFFNEELEACMPVKPGTYQLQAALLTDESNYEIGSKDNLWSTEQTVKVEPGKDTIIEVEAK